MFIFKIIEQKKNILRQHMHKKEFWILTIKCQNDENEAEGPWPLIGQNPKFFFMHVLKKDVLFL
jgi:hypothetical protein